MQKYLLLLLLLIGILSCKKSTGPVKQEPDPPSPVLTLEKTYEPGVTEAWFRLTTENITFNDTVAITCNDSVVLKLTPVRNDTLFYCENLSPNTNYKCQAFYLKNKMLKDSSNAVYVTTLDTTTHNYTWQIYEFGGIPHGHSTFRDIAIIDENDIWAVGDIAMDTSYNAAHWNGQEWELKRIHFDGNPVPYPEIYSVLTFAENDIWFTNGGSFVHFNGENYIYDFSVNHLLDGYLTETWGTSGNNIYAVGYAGTIVHYNGQQWTKLTSPEGAGGTDLPIQDIWG
ncbi:MAG: glucosyl transferase, partial [Calditrichia bacterium]|nr:glucosyl transferase [Calditrichia bacterium]